jgi:hypothetical protein
VPVSKLNGFIGELDNSRDGDFYWIFEEEILSA